MLLAVAPASALDKPATCATLQTVLNGAAQGDVITLNSSEGVGGLSHGHSDLKSFPSPIAFPNHYTTWQFQGDPSNGIDGFDGSDLNGTTERMLTGVNVHRLELQNLVFRDGTVTGNGGALDISGLSTLGLRNSSFFNNHATGKGGAVHFAPDSGTDNPTIGAIGVSAEGAWGVATFRRLPEATN